MRGFGLECCRSVVYAIERMAVVDVWCEIETSLKLKLQRRQLGGLLYSGEATGMRYSAKPTPNWPAHLSRTSRTSASPFARDDTHTSPPSTTMFGPFRLTNPLSGGLLWYDSPPLLSAPPSSVPAPHPYYFASILCTLPPLLLSIHATWKSWLIELSAGKSRGASPATRNTAIVSASEKSITSSRRSTQLWRASAPA